MLVVVLMMEVVVMMTVMVVGKMLVMTKMFIKMITYVHSANNDDTILTAEMLFYIAISSTSAT